MKTLPKIANSEWRVMRVLWQRAPLTANDVVQALEGEVVWIHRTVRTLLNRLVKKGALNYTVEGRTYLYSPAVEEADCLRAERRSFVRRVYGGASTPMLLQFLEEEDLTADDVEALRLMLDKKGRMDS